MRTSGAAVRVGLDIDRERLLLAALPHVPFDGWSTAALRLGARDAGLTETEALALFPGGSTDLVATFSDWADRAMLDRLAETGLEQMKVRDRISLACRIRFGVLAPHREAVRRSLAVLAMPQNAALGMRLVYRTVDAIWYAVGDTATDYNFYTKRLLLAGVLTSTTLYWLNDNSVGHVETHGFLERRIADVMAIPKATAGLRDALDRLPNPLRLLRAARRR